MSLRNKVVSIELPYRVNMSELEVLDASSVRLSTLKFRCENAIDAIKEGDIARAKMMMETAKNIDDRFADFWLISAAIAETPAEQEDHLKHVLVYEPNNLVAIEALGILRGELAADDDPPVARDNAAQVELLEIVCPQCHGRLMYRSDDRDVRCNFCGSAVLDADGLPRTNIEKPTALAMGMLKRKQRPTDWNIGSRVFTCANCGASTTLSKKSLTNSCRFCQSRQVLQESVRSGLEQPDFIVPFRVNEDNARYAIDEALKSGIRIITRFFADPVKEIVLRTAYLPFWVFEGDMSVAWSWTNASDRGVYPVLFDNVLYFAAQTPKRRLIENLEPFQLNDAKDYDPRLLASDPAELYSIDVDQASIDVRTQLVKIGKRQARASSITSAPQEMDWNGQRKNPGRLNLRPQTNYMSYRFGLLPVWVGTLIEEDGDTRQLLVNGQTAKVAIGDLEKQK